MSSLASRYLASSPADLGPLLLPRLLTFSPPSPRSPSVVCHYCLLLLHHLTHRSQTALESASDNSATYFLSAPSCQRTIFALWKGQLVQNNIEEKDPDVLGGTKVVGIQYELVSPSLSPLLSTELNELVSKTAPTSQASLGISRRFQPPAYRRPTLPVTRSHSSLDWIPHLLLLGDPNATERIGTRGYGHLHHGARLHCRGGDEDVEDWRGELNWLSVRKCDCTGQTADHPSLTCSTPLSRTGSSSTS